MKIKKIVLVALIAILTLSILSCATSADYSAVKSDTEAFIDAIIADDFDSAYQLVSNYISEQELRDAYGAIKGYISGVTEYELKQTGWYTNFDLGGATTIKVSYKMTANDGEYEVVVVAQKGQSGIGAFNINRISASEELGSSSSGIIEA